MTTNPCPNCGISNRSSARFCSSCGEPLVDNVPSEMNATAEATLQPGAMLQDRYRIENELGRGGFGAVYRAYDTRLKKYCAVKENLEISPEAQRQFSREATVLAGLNHPNLPRVTDHFAVEDTGQYLVMDFIEGDDLQTWVHREGRLPVGKALKWVLQVADALIYLHSRVPPVVHRDIKPANIRITSDDRAVLVDFGLVKLYDPGLRTTIGARAITPGYAPPEQYGRGGSTDVRSDIYGLGATFYNALTGKEPLESVQRMSGDQMLPVHQVNPAVQPHVGGAIERAMALNPDNRFQTAEAFKAALAEPAPTMVVEPIRAPQASAGVAPRVAPDRSYQRAPARTPSQPAPKKKTGRIIIGVLAVVFILCLGTVGVFAWLMAESEEQANLESTDRAISVNQTATAFKNTLATKTALVDERATVTAEALHAAETASAQAATATAEAAAAQTAQALQAPLEAAKGWGVIAEDYFQDNVNEWATGEREGTYAKITWTLADGVYRWDTLAYDGFVWWVYPEISPVSDFYLAADMTFVEGPPVAEMGLMFWHTEDNTYYVFEIDNQDDFAVFYYDSSEWTTIYEWTESDAIIPGGMNRLAVVAEGDHLLFYINDQHVAEVFNAAATTGNVGLIVGLDEADQTGIWEFYNFELRAP